MNFDDPSRVYAIKVLKSHFLGGPWARLPSQEFRRFGMISCFYPKIYVRGI